MAFCFAPVTPGTSNPEPSPSGRAVAGTSQMAQCSLFPLFAVSAKTMAYAFAPVEPAAQDSGGDTSWPALPSPAHVYFVGIVPLLVNAELVSLKSPGVPPPE